MIDVPELLDLQRRIAEHGVSDEETLDTLLDATRRAILSGAEVFYKTRSDEADALGTTRGALTKWRKKLGFEPRHGGRPKNGGIPQDWRDRLEATK